MTTRTRTAKIIADTAELAASAEARHDTVAVREHRRFALGTVGVTARQWDAAITRARNSR